MYDASGAPAFTLSRSQASGLGQPEIRSFFDGRVVLTVKDGIRIVKAADGTAEPGFEAIPPGTFRMNNVPVAAGTHAVVLGPTDGLGNLGESDYGLVAVISDEPLAWDLLSVALPGSE